MGIVYEKYLLLASKMCYLSAFFVSSGIAAIKGAILPENSLY